MKNGVNSQFERGFGVNTIAEAVGRSEATVSGYLSDLRARHELAQDLKIFKMGLLSIPQERIAQRLGMEPRTVGYHLEKTSELKKLPNELLTKGFLPNTIAEKLGWPEPLVCTVALEGKDDVSPTHAQGERWTFPA